jgi:hypothetical protein
MNLNPFHRTQSEKVRDSIIDNIRDKKKRLHFFSVLSIIFLFLAIFIGIFIGLLQNQEIRKQASEGTGKAEIILVPSSTPLRADTLSTVFIRLNTHGEAVDGIQVVFDLLTDTTDEVSVRIKQGTGLRWAWDRVQGIEGGKKISFAAITSDPYKPFSSNQPVDIAEITFVAKKTGNLAMVFDGFATKANRHQQLKNVLKPIIIQEYQIASAPTPVPTPRVVATAKPATNSANTDLTTTKGEEKVATDSVTAMITISSNTNTSNLGGSYGQIATVSDRACNEACQSSVECGTGFLCYENQCRLSTNLTSVKCEDIAQRSKSCNEDCNQAIECQTGLTCFEGSCRDTSNPQSEVCQNDQTVTANIESNCGQECGVNQDCGDSLSCFDGLCRLATNPESPNCSQKEVVIKNLGSSNQGTDIKQPAIVADEESSLSLLTQVVIALALTVVIGMLGSVAYTFIRRRNNSREL